MQSNQELNTPGKHLLARPLQFLKMLFSKKTLNKVIAQLYDPAQSDERKAIAAAIGILVGILPIWGFQTLAGIFAAVALKLNKALVILFSQISIPPMIPFIIFLSYKAGGWWMGSHHKELLFSTNLSVKNISENLEQYLYGSFTLAIAGSIIVGLLMYAYLKAIKAIKSYRIAAAGKQAI
jgi:uncharacterized protein (DUF2062 family)